MGSLGPFEILLIFLVILLVFGAKRIPEIARGLGKGIREFKAATTELKSELTVDTQHRIQPPQGTPAPRTDAYTQPAPQQQPAPADRGSSAQEDQ
jgi:sec-independent protein translocase protein TatA